ncbi:glycosyltransferase [Pseudomonadota bacterium]
MVNSLAGGGAEKVVVTLYPEYQKAGVQLSLLCLEMNNFYNIKGVSPTYLSSQTGSDEGGFKKLSSLISFALKLKKYSAKNQIDLVQSHIYRSNYVNVLARIMGAKHKVQIANHGMPSQYGNEGLSGRINLFLIKWLYPKADQVICPSQGMINEFMQLGVPKEKLQLIRNPFDIEELQRLSKQEMIPEEFAFDPDKKYLICIGRLQAVKRMEDIVWAFYELQKSDDKGELLILGEGEKWDAIAALKMQLAISKKVHMIGQVENPHKFLARSNVFVSASEFEGFSNVIVEALAAGTPVLSTDCESGPREILDPEKTREHPIAPGCVEKVRHGLMVPVGDIKAMTKAMRQLLDEPDLKNVVSGGGKDRAAQFDKESIANKYLEQCSEVLGSNP